MKRDLEGVAEPDEDPDGALSRSAMASWDASKSGEAARSNVRGEACKLISGEGARPGRPLVPAEGVLGEVRVGETGDDACDCRPRTSSSNGQWLTEGANSSIKCSRNVHNRASSSRPQTSATYDLSVRPMWSCAIHLCIPPTKFLWRISLQLVMMCHIRKRQLLVIGEWQDSNRLEGLVRRFGDALRLSPVHIPKANVVRFPVLDPLDHFPKERRTVARTGRQEGSRPA